MVDFDWIASHISDDPTRLRLKYGSERSDDILQIECRRKYAAKLRNTLAANPRFVFPSALSGEQSTSDALAAFHSSLVVSGGVVADLTAGLGIDAMALAGNASEVIAVERNQNTAEALRTNGAGLHNLKVIQGDCRDFVADTERHFDCLFIDPARRAADGSRTYALDQCEPDVVAMLPDIRRISDMLIVKASPMLDITHTLRLLPEATQAIVVGTSTECKELDIICRFDQQVDEAMIRAVTIASDGRTSEFAFTRSEEAAAVAPIAMPREGQYLYEPYPAVMKSGAVKLLAQRFGLTKLHANTHVWVGNEAVEDFPGHIFYIEEVLPYASKHIKRYAARHPRVSVTTRNFDMSADVLRAKLRVTDGPGRLFAVTAADNTRLLLTCR